MNLRLSWSMLVQPTGKVWLMLLNLASLVENKLLSLDAAAGCLSLIADTHSVVSTAFNRMQTASLLCDLLRKLEASPVEGNATRTMYFTKSTAHFTRILPQVIAAAATR